MKNALDETFLQIEERIKKLPKKMQVAFAWMIANYAEVEELCKAEPLSEEKRQQFMEAAIRKDDALMIILLVAEKVINTQSDDTSEM